MEIRFINVSFQDYYRIVHSYLHISYYKYHELNKLATFPYNAVNVAIL